MKKVKIISGIKKLSVGLGIIIPPVIKVVTEEQYRKLIIDGFIMEDLDVDQFGKEVKKENVVVHGHDDKKNDGRETEERVSTETYTTSGVTEVDTVESPIGDTDTENTDDSTTEGEEQDTGETSSDATVVKKNNTRRNNRRNTQPNNN